MSRVAVTSAGPRIKFAPFVKLRGFSVETNLLFPLADDAQSNPWLDFDAYQFVNKFFYDQDLSSMFRLFAQFDTYLRLNKFDMAESSFETPIKLFVSYYPNENITIYTANEYSIVWSSVAPYYFQTGLGAKYQFLPQMEVEMLYTVFPFGKDRGAGQTYNVGIRIIR
jgi:hypothetical protein